MDGALRLLKGRVAEQGCSVPTPPTGGSEGRSDGVSRSSHESPTAPFSSSTAEEDLSDL